LETQRAQQEANILALIAQKDQAVAVTAMQDGTTASALEQARTNLALREADYRRYEKLLQEQAISRQAFDSARTSYEAAQIDGADKMAQLRYVVLPSILSTIVIMLITRIGSLLNIGYEKVLLLYNTNTYVTADVVSTFANRNGMGSGAGTGIAAAAEMMNNVIGMMLVIGANTIAKKASDTSLY
jgi:ABC-type glycerol-3-phosphate transport system permease component